MMLLWVLTTLWLGACLGDDSLRGALEAINRRQRDLADPTLYYLEHFHPPRERVMYPRHGDGNPLIGDGQPEDIGYGYQKSLAPNTAGVFDAVPLPESEIGAHGPGVESHIHHGKDFDNIMLDYIEDNMDRQEGSEPQVYHYPNQNPNTKRSVFRERDIHDLPDTLQHMYPEEEGSDRFFENGERHHDTPTSFRERFSSKPLRKHGAENAQTLVRNFGGLNRDSENYPENDNDPDEYLSVLNSVWEKYQDNNPDNFDPEALSESDVEEILSYLNHKQERKRQPEESYGSGYDYFNSPLLWVKRDRQRLTENPKPSSDEFLHALKFINGHRDTLETMREEDVPDEERDEDVAKLLMDEQTSRSNKRYIKRFWRGNSYEDHHRNVKRYPIAKRSPSYTSPAVLYHKSSGKFNLRRKKNVGAHPSDGTTDPKVARELNDIFSSSDNTSKAKNVHEMSGNPSFNSSQVVTLPGNTTKKENLSDSTSHHKSLDEDAVPDHNHGVHIKKKRSGQKEETGFDSQHKPLEMSKKSVNWSNYFGIDRRRKKSSSKPTNNEWLLDQYLKAYSISARAFKENGDDGIENTNSEIDKKTTDDMDAKLRAMEDMIVDQALKYTGAHEGTTDSEEVQAVKDRVIAQLAAAYSLEKMRKALGEFKSSIAAQKASAPVHTTTTNSPTDAPEQKDKRVAVKKEKAEDTSDEKLEKKESDNDLSVFRHAEHSHSKTWNQEEESCPVINDISLRCKEIANMAGDSSNALASLCNLHQVCYLCGAEMGTTPTGCDITFLTEANSVCGESPRCRYSVRRTMAAMHALRGDPSPLGCDWQNHPCLARYLAISTR